VVYITYLKSGCPKLLYYYLPGILVAFFQTTKTPKVNFYDL